MIAFVMKFMKRMKKLSADRNESNVLTVEDMRSTEVIVFQNIVILKDDISRQNEWKLTKVIEVFPDKKGFVQMVKLLICSIDRNGIMANQTFVRPVDKARPFLERHAIAHTCTHNHTKVFRCVINHMHK